ncbi:MAG: 7-cyano-7-deazaguanine synthase, partial [Candidatus Aminicenantaceae bacterium]
MDFKNSVPDRIQELKKTIGEERAISALSGGVDSSACTVLAHRAIGDNLKSIFIDDGLMREGEAQSVVSLFRDLGVTVEIVDAQDAFFTAL